MVYAIGSPAECQMMVFENPFGMNRQACKVLDMMLGAAILVCEQRNIPWALIVVASIKKHLAGKGNAKKPDMMAAAVARWGGEFTEHEAEAAGAAAVFLDAQE